MSVRFHLDDTTFGPAERTVCETGTLAVSTFRYPSGVAALRLRNARGEIVLLPYQGQQIWRATFDGRPLTMRSMFDEPVVTRAYLETYGAFLNHCGITGLGAPGPTDAHPLHGELPNAPFQSAWIEVDASGEAVTLGGHYDHIVAFATNYRATVETRLAAGSALLDVSVTVENRKASPMDLMYLGHANFRPVDDGELHYSAPYTPDAVRVRRSIPAHVTPKPGYRKLLERLAVDPAVHHVLAPRSVG